MNSNQQTKLDQATDLLSELLKSKLPIEEDSKILEAQELLLSIQ